jgi:hypothetical protein
VGSFPNLFEGLRPLFVADSRSLRLVAVAKETTATVRSVMRRSNLPNGLCSVQQNKDLHDLTGTLFHIAVPSFKNCCFAES